MRVIHFRTIRLLASVAGFALLGTILAGCKTTHDPDITGSLGTPTSHSEQEWRREANAFGERYRANPDDSQAAIAYAHALRMIGQRAQAAAVLEQASIHHPYDQAVLGAFGRALADAGRLQQALDVLTRAHTPEHPDWRILSVQGAVLDQMGRHDEARRHYESALRIQPNDPSVLSNLGLSYALSKDLARAEQTLRKAAAHQPIDPRVRQNLALVVGLRGHFAEAETIARADLPSNEAAANVAFLRQMLAQQHNGAKRPKSQRTRRTQHPERVGSGPGAGGRG